MTVKVWWDEKRKCYSTNAPILYAKKHGLPTGVAAAILLERVYGKLLEAGVESVEYEEPKKGVIWRALLSA